MVAAGGLSTALVQVCWNGLKDAVKTFWSEPESKILVTYTVPLYMMPLARTSMFHVSVSSRMSSKSCSRSFKTVPVGEALLGRSSVKGAPFLTRWDAAPIPLDLP